MTTGTDDTMEWWLRLRHGGQLLDRAQLEALPAPEELPWKLPEKLRAAIIALPEEGAATGDELATLIDLMLEEVTGLKAGWFKGAKVGSDYRETLLDGTEWKPRRVWKGPRGGSLHVFTTKVRQVGLHKGRRPVAQITEYLRRRGVPLGLLTNGRQWRLIYADADTQAWVEWDTTEFFSGGQLSDSVVGFARLLGRQALVRQQDAGSSPLLGAIAETRQGQAKLSAELGERVRKAVEALLVSRRPVLEDAWDALDSQAVYVAACHFMMRLVVTLFAEARGLLPEENPVYHNAYGVTGLLEALDRVSPLRLRSRHTGWSRLLALYSLLYKGSPHPALILPAYGGDLFRPGRADGDDVQRALHILESTSSPPNDEVIHNILVMLTRTTVRVRDGRSWRRVSEAINFTDLSSEYIGILYEGLLDYELHRAGSDPVLFLNLGDQPALPISRLEAMDDKAIKALVEKVKDDKGLVFGTEDEGEEPEPDDLDVDPAPVEGDDGLEGDADDLREAALQRAMTWARRAVKVGKLVKKAKGKDPLEQQQRAADALIADVKLPGELYLVRWGGTRKGAGTFYTRPQLTMPTVRRTLEPLTHQGKEPRTPEEILQLKVVDPAMGSGSFLVAALRVLTKTIIEGAYVHGRVHPEGNRTRVEISTLAESDRIFPFASDDPRFAEDFEDRIKRYVVEHCLYGVDIDPLAVELARVALWVETLDDKLPFTFLDHKLKVGNSLVGCWMDRFRDYPALAWARESPDKGHKGVHHAKNSWHEALATKKKSVIEELRAVIKGQASMGFEGGDDAQVHEDVKRLRSLFGELRRVPADQPARRARLYRTKIQTDPALKRLREAFDAWCALWFWPLDQLDAAPMPGDFLGPSEATREVSRRIARSQRFFHWELEFPDVFHIQGSGFDAVVGNPPWETVQPESKEFFSNLDPLYRSYGKQDALRVQQEMFSVNPRVEQDWLGYQAVFKDTANWLRNTGNPFGDASVAGHDGDDLSFGKKVNSDLHTRWGRARKRHSGFSDSRHPFLFQGKGKPYTYKMFAEAGYALLHEDGELGLLLPSGVYTDQGSGDLRRLLLEQSRWQWLFGFENRHKVFDIDSRFKFCALIAKKGGRTEAMKAAFMRRDLADWGNADDADYVLDYPAERVRAFSPESLSVLEIRSEPDLAVLTKIYANCVLLGDDGPNGWGITYAQGDFNMTSDSKLFPSREKWEEKGYRSDEYGRWIGPDGDLALPLYEGRMIGQFDFSEKGWVSGKGRSAVWRDIPWEEKVVEPQYLMAEADFVAAIEPRPWKLLMMNIGSATNQRTMLASLGPNWPANHSLAVLSANDAADDLPLVAVLDSFVYDWSLRLRLGGLNLSWFILEETPLPGVADAVSGLVAALVHGAHPAMSNVAAKYGHNFRAALAPHERLRLRAMLDAVVAVLYSLTGEDFEWILRDCDHSLARLSERTFTRNLDPKGFWRVDNDKLPELRHTVLSLVAFHDLQAMIASNGGDRDAGIHDFCEQNGGDGWLLPETLRLADYGLGHDDRAKEYQPVASVLGPRFLDWQLAQTPEESWAECERHARALTSSQGSHPPKQTSGNTSQTNPPPKPQIALAFDEDER